MTIASVARSNGHAAGHAAAPKHTSNSADVDRPKGPKASETKRAPFIGVRVEDLKIGTKVDDDRPIDIPELTGEPAFRKSGWVSEPAEDLPRLPLEDFVRRFILPNVEDLDVPAFRKSGLI